MPRVTRKMPTSPRGASLSPRSRTLSRAVMGGPRDLMSREMREPISTKARKRKMSPNTKPTSPEMESQSQAWGGASRGSASPRVSQAVRVKRGKATKIRK